MVNNAPGRSGRSGSGDYSFQVDLRGIVDLLSHHLYSSPRVYIRELLQNAVDAVTARRQRDALAPTAIRLVVDESGLRITDHGIGLTEADVHRFLATIGNSSKRDDIEGARREFLGQFGIGLLACFTVAETIRVVTRSAIDPAALPVEWLAAADGTYSLRLLDPAAQQSRAPRYISRREPVRRRGSRPGGCWIWSAIMVRCCPMR